MAVDLGYWNYRRNCRIYDSFLEKFIFLIYNYIDDVKQFG